MEDFNEMKSPVFIVGAPRSGTTWLWGLLTSHPDIIPLVREDFDISQPSVIDNRRITSETGAFVNYKDKHIIDVIKKKYFDNPEKIIIEKTPSHIFYVDRIFSMFPKSKILYIMRDPRAVISSMLLSNFFHFADSIDDAVKKYRDCVSAITPYLNSSKLHKIRYEDLIIDTENTLSEVFDFIHLPKENIQTIIQENTNVSKVKLDGVFRKGVIDSYKKDLKMQNIRKIEKELGDVLTNYGYEISS